MNYHEIEQRANVSVKNKEIATLFYTIADALEIKGEQVFKILAYRKAARILEDMTDPVETLAGEKKLGEIPGLGTGIVSKVEEYLSTGKMKKYEEALSGIPDGLLGLLDIPNLGPKTIKLAYEELGVENLDNLKDVIRSGRLAGLRGMGEKKVENIRKGIELREKSQERISIFEALTIAEEVIAYLGTAPGIGRVAPAGSLRRMKETIGDIDILAEGKKSAEIIRFFTLFPKVSRVISLGETKGSVLISADGGGRQVDLRLVDESEFGAALQYFTGSKDHNIKLRGMAKDRGLKISEYGVFRGTKKIAGREEEEVYAALGLPWIPPELREDRGEIELAVEKRLPKIVDYAGIRGDLHVHSDWSDGTQSLEEIASAAKALGYAYVAVCDHSQSARYASGLTPERLLRQMAEIDKLNGRLKGIKLLRGTEADILADGRLDFADGLLQKLDVVVASVHSGFKKNVTARILRALENPFVTTIGHPSGRLISGREGYDVDLDQVLEAARISGKGLELNAYYDRLDLNEFYLKKARDRGIRIALGTDSHSANGLAMMRFGVGIARRAWLGDRDVLNTLPLARLLEVIKKR